MNILCIFRVNILVVCPMMLTINLLAYFKHVTWYLLNVRSTHNKYRCQIIAMLDLDMSTYGIRSAVILVFVRSVLPYSRYKRSCIP